MSIILNEHNEYNEHKKLTSKQFEKYSKLIKESFGVNITESKFDMIQGRLAKLTKKAGVSCFDEYYDLITMDKSQYWSAFVDEVTIHKTNFFREDGHFNFIKNKINRILERNPRIEQNREVRVWSTACSYGHEPYTLAMVLKECLPTYINIKILGTDISPKVISAAQKAEYILDSEDLINAYYLTKYFEKKDEKYCINEDLKRLLTFRVFNLMNPLPFKNTFDIIFCRNVMIYFDENTQERLIKKFYNVTAQGGLLFIGHSESLSKKQHEYKYVQPTIYTKH